jgi:hypothetical protein
MNKIAGIVLFFALSCATTSCGILGKGGKKHKEKNKTVAVAETPPMVAVVPVPPVAVVPPANVEPERKSIVTSVAPLWAKRLAYKTFSGKAKVNYKGPGTSQEFTANFRIKKDSVIWIMITGLGGLVPVARIYITPDSFFMVNMLQREATRMPLKDAAKLLPAPVEFSSLQNLIVGEPLRDGKITDAVDTANTWVLAIADNSYQQRIAYSKMDSTMQHAQLATIAPNGPHGVMDYRNYTVVRDRKLSTNRIVNLQNSTDTYQFEMNFVNSDFDQVLEFPFSIPRNYKVK